jgi:tetratricopeptide (TPR) repeat protein
MMSIPEIAQELQSNLDLLETSMRDVPARHRSMRMVFDHSWRLLVPQERLVLIRLSVFSGGFTRKAAESIAGASLSLLSSLVSKSLLRYLSQEDRYDLHGLIRQYADGKLHEQLEEEYQAHSTHCQYYAVWIAELERPLKSALQIETSALIRSETANWIAAWHWAARHGRADLLRKMIPCLYWYYEIHGYYAEALSSYQFAEKELRTAGAPEGLPTAEERTSYAFLVDQLGWFTFRMGNIEEADRLFAESSSLIHGYPDQEILYHIHGNWSYLALTSGRIDEAETLTMESLANARALNSQWHIAIPTNILGIIHHQRGNLNDAYKQLTETLEVWRKVGDPVVLFSACCT